MNDLFIQRIQFDWKKITNQSYLKKIQVLKGL